MSTGIRTITERRKEFRLVAEKVGWHVHAGEQYIGYDEMLPMADIVAKYSAADSPLRLTYIGGNLLVFTA